MTKYPSQMQDKFNLRFPDGMRDAIAERAKRNGRSMNSEIVQILQDAIVIDEFSNLDANPVEVQAYPDLNDEQPTGDAKKKLDDLIQSAAEEAAHAAINIILHHYDVQPKKKPT